METIYENNGLRKAWDFIVGKPEEFTAENRRVNALGAIALVLFLIFQPINFVVALPEVAMLTLILTGIQAIVYYLARFRKKYTLAVAMFAFTAFAGLIVCYYYDSGMKGPNIYLFFLSFQILISITKRRYHLLWFVLHALLGCGLMVTEYLIPDFVPGSYGNREQYFFDFILTFIICLAFIYIITNYLLRIYIKEKKTAREHALAIEAQNYRLKEIARLQSHEVRNHVATIMGLTQLFNPEDMNDPANKEVISGIAHTIHHLDEAVKNINTLTQEIRPGEVEKS